MCRVAVRQAPRNRPEEVKREEPSSLLYDQLPAFQGQPSALNVRLDEDEIDFENLFEDDEDPGLEAGELDLLALFSDDACPAPGPQMQQQPQQQQAVGVVPAAVAYVAPAAVTAVAPVQPEPVAQTVQQLQLQAIMQQQMAAQQQQYAGPAALPEDLAHLQQYQAAQMQAMLAAQASLRQGQAVNKRGKTQAEVEEQQERIKKRRRESAQRSRARKNSYMKTLEVENKALKMENERLRMELMKLTGNNKTGSTSSSKPDTPSQHMMMVSDHDHSGELSMSDDDICDDKAGLSKAVAANFFPLVL